MDTQSRSWNWGFVGLWTLTGALGATLFGFAALASVWELGDLVANVAGEIAGIAVAGAAFGGVLALGLSLGPGLLLRGRGIHLGRWIGWSVLGGAFGTAIIFAVLFDMLDANTLPEWLTGPVMGIVLGLSIGLGQWRALGDRAGAGLWPAIAVVAQIAAFMVGLPLGGEGREWLALGAVGLLASAITGLGMGWVLSARRVAAAAT